MYSIIKQSNQQELLLLIKYIFSKYLKIVVSLYKSNLNYFDIFIF